MPYTTLSKVIKDFRLTIPIEIREVAGIKIGDYVNITIEKIEKPHLCEFAGCRNPGKLCKNVYGFKDTYVCDLHRHQYERETGKALEEVIE